MPVSNYDPDIQLRYGTSCVGKAGLDHLGHYVPTKFYKECQKQHALFGMTGSVIHLYHEDKLISLMKCSLGQQDHTGAAKQPCITCCSLKNR